MILSLLSFFVGLVLLIIIPIKIFNFKNTEKNNYYFLFILCIAGIQRFVYGLFVFEVIESSYLSFIPYIFYGLFISLLFYLYLKNLLIKTTSFKEDLGHFSVLFILIAISLVLDIKTRKFIYLLYSTVYLISLIYLLKKTLFAHKNLFEQKQFNSIKNWGILIVLLTMTLYFISNYVSLVNLESVESTLSQFYSVSALFWLALIIYLMYNPLLLYGREILTIQHIAKEKDVFKLWSLKLIKKIEKKDIGFKKNITYTNIQMVDSFHKLEQSYFSNFTETPTIEGIAEALNKPQSHIKYFFKYYCNYSFNEYCNILKIKHALLLMEDDYLKNHTIESLSKKCLFNSRITFFHNFKKIIGISPTEYLKTRSKSYRIERDL
jgi:AraC-like DNA-binding protein